MRLPLALALTLFAAPAFAADGARAKQAVIVASPAREAGLRPKLALSAVPMVVSLPPPAHPGEALAPLSFAFNGLDSGGLRSGLPRFDDARGQCFTTCSSARYLCESRQEDSDCQSRWVTCISGCGS